MPKQIQVENQIIEFPDDMPDNEIEAVIKKEFYSQPQEQQPAPQAPTQPMQQPKPYGRGAELVKKAAEYIPQQGKVGAFLNTATNLGGMPRVKALTASLTAKALGGDESIGQFYDEALGNELSKLRQAREQYPKTSIAGQLLADVATARLLGLKGATAKQALAGGAVLGGLSAAGETQADLSSGQALADTASGALYGAGGGLVGQQVGKAIGKSVPFVKKTIQRLKGSTPESILSTVLTPQEAAQQAGKLAERVEQGRITALPELGNENILGLTRILGKTQGSNKIINDYINKKTATSAKRVGDLLNNNLSAESYFNKLDDAIARRKEITGPLYKQAEIEGEQYLKNLLKKSELPTINSVNPTGSIFVKYQPKIRAKANLANNITTLDKTLNVSPDEIITIYRGAPKNQKNIVSGDFITTNYQLAKDYAGDGIVLTKKVKASNILDDIDEPLGEEYIYRTNNPKITSPKKNLFDNPNIDKYIRKAINDPLSPNPKTTSKFEQLQNAKIAVDKEIGAMKNDFGEIKEGFGKDYYAANEIRKEINAILEKASPTYKEANKIFAGESALINAQKEGLKFNKYRNGEEVKRAFSKLTDGEKETFKIGVKDYLLDKVAKSSERNPAKAIFGNQLEYGKLKALFNNPKEFKDFAQRLSDEIRVFDVKQRIVGGSRTDFNLAESDQLLDKIAKGAVNAKTFGVADVLLTAKNLIQKQYYGLNEQTAKQLAEIMIDPEKSVNLLNNVYKKAQTDAERGLIQRFTQDYLAKRNFTRTLAPSMGRAMATEQLKQEENQNGI